MTDNVPVDHGLGRQRPLERRLSLVYNRGIGASALRDRLTRFTLLGARVKRALRDRIT